MKTILACVFLACAVLAGCNESKRVVSFEVSIPDLTDGEREAIYDQYVECRKFYRRAMLDPKENDQIKLIRQVDYELWCVLYNWSIGNYRKGTLDTEIAMARIRAFHTPVDEPDATASK